MADRIKGITIEIGGDTTGLSKSLDGVNSQIKNTSAQLKDVERLLKLDPTNTELLAQKQKLLAEKLQESESKLEALRSADAQLAQQLSSGEIGQEQYDAFQREIASTEIEVKKTQEELQDAGKAAEDSGDKGEKAGGKMSKAFKAAAATAAAITAACIAAVKAGVDAIKNVAETGDAIDKMSQKLGISAEAYQEWNFIAQHSGTSMDSLQTSMKTLATQAQKNADKFAKLGLSVENVQSMTQEDLFAATIAGLQEMGESTERTALASELLGRGATELGALLNTSAEDTAAMREQVHQLGGVLSNESVAAAAKFNDSMQNLKAAAGGLVNNLSATFLPQITQVMDGITSILSGDEGGLEEMEAGIEGFMENLAENLVSNIPRLIALGFTIVKGLIEGIIKAIPSLISGMGELLDKVVDILAELWDAAKDAGKNLVRGLWEGIQTLAKWLWDKVSDWISGIWDGICDFFGIHSPSVKMEWIGKMIDAGLGKGIEKNSQDAIGAAAGLSAGVLTASASTISNVQNYGGVAVNVYGSEAQSATDIANEVMYKIQHAVDMRSTAYA